MSASHSNGAYLAISRRIPATGMTEYQCEIIISQSGADDCYWTTEHITIENIDKVTPLYPHVYRIHYSNKDLIVQIM